MMDNHLIIKFELDCSIFEKMNNLYSTLQLNSIFGYHINKSNNQFSWGVCARVQIFLLWGCRLTFSYLNSLYELLFLKCYTVLNTSYKVYIPTKAYFHSPIYTISETHTTLISAFFNNGVKLSLLMLAGSFLSIIATQLVLVCFNLFS